MAVRADTELVQLSNRLLHDVQVFSHVGRRLVRWRLGFTGSLSWEVEMALVESFALHTRALSDFFYVPKRGRHVHNAYAFDFFEPASWRPPDQGLWLRRIKRAAKREQDRIDRFGEQLGHITSKEPPISDYARGWPVAQVMNEVGLVLRAFVEDVDDRKVASDFKTKAWREIPAVARIRDGRSAVGLWTQPVATRPLGG